MKSSNIKKALKTCYNAKRPAFLWGAPGVGKSNVVKQTADELNIKLIDVRAALLDPTDLRGLPFIDKSGRAVWSSPDFLPREGAGILFLDELNSAPPLTMAACYQLILDRKLGEYELPAGWIAIGAGNRRTDRAIVNEMSSALSNRFANHIDFDIDVDEFIAWALRAGIETEIIAFIRFRPNLLHSFDPKKNERAFPSPRSWEFMSDLLKAGIDPECLYDMICGCIGEGAGAEFTAFLKIYKSLPSPDMVILNPDGAPVPDDPATLYALTGALSRRASDQTFDKLVKYSYRLPAEFSVLMVSDIVKRDAALISSRAFIEWSSKNNSVLI